MLDDVVKSTPSQPPPSPATEPYSHWKDRAFLRDVIVFVLKEMLHNNCGIHVHSDEQNDVIPLIAVAGVPWYPDNFDDKHNARSLFSLIQQLTNAIVDYSHPNPTTWVRIFNVTVDFKTPSPADADFTFGNLIVVDVAFTAGSDEMGPLQEAVEQINLNS